MGDTYEPDSEIDELVEELARSPAILGGPGGVHRTKVRIRNLTRDERGGGQSRPSRLRRSDPRGGTGQDWFDSLLTECVWGHLLRCGEVCDHCSDAISLVDEQFDETVTYRPEHFADLDCSCVLLSPTVWSGLPGVCESDFPASVGLARQFLGRALARAGHPELVRHLGGLAGAASIGVGWGDHVPLVIQVGQDPMQYAVGAAWALLDGMDSLARTAGFEPDAVLPDDPLTILLAGVQRPQSLDIVTAFRAAHALAQGYLSRVASLARFQWTVATVAAPMTGVEVDWMWLTERPSEVSAGRYGLGWSRPVEETADISLAISVLRSAYEGTELLVDDVVVKPVDDSIDGPDELSRFRITVNRPDPSHDDVVGILRQVRAIVESRRVSQSRETFIRAVERKLGKRIREIRRMPRGFWGPFIEEWNRRHPEDQLSAAAAYTRWHRARKFSA